MRGCGARQGPGSVPSLDRATVARAGRSGQVTREVAIKDGQKRCGCGKGCRTFGACLRGKRLQYTEPGQQYITAQWDDHLDRYEWAVRQGIQPTSTLREETEMAIAISEATGEPFRADE